MKNRVVAMLAVLFVAAMGLAGCKSWAPNTTEPTSAGQGSCSVDREWVPAKQDPATGEWKEGYCEWKPGKSG
jgi:hypothetical protein